jgi:hypothetical protein
MNILSLAPCLMAFDKIMTHIDVGVGYVQSVPDSPIQEQNLLADKRIRMANEEDSHEDHQDSGA